MASASTYRFVSGAIAVLMIASAIAAAFRLQIPLEQVRLESYDMNCSRREVRGRRYLWINDNSGGQFRTLSRIENCQSITKTIGPATMQYRVGSSNILGLIINDLELLSPDKSKRTLIFVFLISELLLGFLLFLYLGMARKSADTTSAESDKRLT